MPWQVLTHLIAEGAMIYLVSKDTAATSNDKNMGYGVHAAGAVISVVSYKSVKDWFDYDYYGGDCDPRFEICEGYAGYCDNYYEDCDYAEYGNETMQPGDYQNFYGFAEDYY